MRRELSGDRGIPGCIYSVQFSTHWKRVENRIFGDATQYFTDSIDLNDSNGVMKELRIGYNICVFNVGKEEEISNCGTVHNAFRIEYFTT